MDFKKTYNGVVYTDWKEYIKVLRSFCRTSKCPFYYGDIDECMFGEIDSDNPSLKKCVDHK